MAERVHLVEVGPRDGLQNEPAPIPTEDKIALIDLLSACGFETIEATAFVSPKWVPQMADAAQVLAGIRRAPGVRYAALIPNLKGYVAAREAGADEMAVFAAASETFSKRNINASIAESLGRFAPVAAAAAADGIALRGYVSCVTDCPYEGPVAPDVVAAVAARLVALGCAQVSLGETLGRGTPDAVAAMLDAVIRVVPPRMLAGHFHDTGGRALANIAVGLKAGLRVFDSAIGGLGGCPFAPGAAGNVASERAAAWLSSEGWVVGLDVERLGAAAEFARGLRAHEAVR